MSANQIEPELTYTQQAIRAAQEHAFSKGLVRMSNAELRRLRGRRNWDGIVAQSVGKDEAQTVSAKISLGQIKGVNDSYARDKVPGLAGLQPSPQLMGLIEDYSGSVVIKRLIILGPKAPSWKHGPRSVKGRGPRDTYG